MLSYMVQQVAMCADAVKLCNALQVLEERLERAGIVKDVTPNVTSARQRNNIRHDCHSRNDSDEDSDF